MGKRVDLDKLRTINSGGKHRDDSRARLLRNDHGRITAIQIDHPDGSVEGVVRPAPVKTRVSTSTGQVVADG